MPKTMKTTPAATLTATRITTRDDNEQVRALVVTCLATAAALAGCGSSGQSTDDPVVRAPTTSTAAAKPKPAKPGTRVTTYSTRFGRIVTDRKGRTLYVFTREKSKVPRCYGQCAKAWPPLLTRGRPAAAKGARARLLGTTRRRGGAVQVTYKGRPLYYYFRERKAGEVFCQNVAEYGGTWLVADPSGRPVQ
jgi:predicted lipoprotein with Yx(FWY)xxD motif